MKKFLNVFFVTLGVIFFIIIIFGIYFYIADPLNIRSMFSKGDSKIATSTVTNSNLSANQQKALETFGINPASVPSKFTPEQEACFETRLGKERVAQIKAGDTPTAAEYYKAKDCV